MFTIILQDFSNLEQEIKKLKVKVDGHQMIVNLKERKLSLQKEMLWAEVKDAEDELAQEQQNRDKILKKLEEFKMKTQSRSQDVEIYENNIETNKMEHQSLQGQLKSEQERQLNHRRQLDQFQDALSTKKRENQDISIQIESKNRDVQNLRKQIADSSEK